MVSDIVVLICAFIIFVLNGTYKYLDKKNSPKLKNLHDLAIYIFSTMAVIISILAISDIYKQISTSIIN